MISIVLDIKVYEMEGGQVLPHRVQFPHSPLSSFFFVFNNKVTRTYLILNVEFSLNTRIRIGKLSLYFILCSPSK